ncbi:MAG: hypothetical protein IJU92_09540 [Spirochaetaceae bacterium]|nr:hypothetical protein [Spirochaetaceae bacterium]
MSVVWQNETISWRTASLRATYLPVAMEMYLYTNLLYKIDYRVNMFFIGLTG